MVGRTGKEKLLVWWKGGGLVQGTASMVMDWNRKTSSVADGLNRETSSVVDRLTHGTASVVDGLAQGTISIMDGSDPPLLGEEGSYTSDREAGVEA